MLFPTTMTEQCRPALSVSENRPLNHLPASLSFMLIIISCTRLVFKLHVCFCCTPGSLGGAVEVRDFKKKAKEGKSYIITSLK